VADIFMAVTIIFFMSFIIGVLLLEEGFFTVDKFSTKELMKSAIKLCKSINYNIPVKLEDLQRYKQLLERDEKKLKMVISSLKLIEGGDNNKAVNDLKRTRDSLHNKVLKNKGLIKGLIVKLTNTKLLGIDNHTGLDKFTKNTEELQQYNTDLAESFKEVSSF